MLDDEKWERLIWNTDCVNRKIRSHCIHGNLALAIQLVTEECVIKIAGEAKKLTGSDNLCMAGGVALNGVANGKLQRSGLFKQIYIQPAAGDAGGAVGAALAAYHMYYDKPKIKHAFYDGMNGSYLGPSFANPGHYRAFAKNLK